MSFKPTGFGRFLIVPFLGVWLCGWAMGESFAALVLASLLGVRLAPASLHGLPFANAHVTGPGDLVVLSFLLVWLALWTLAGLTALRALADLVWASDEIAFGGDDVCLSRQRGPIRWSRKFLRQEIRGIQMSVRRATLVLRTEKHEHLLTTYGSRRERRELRDELRSALGVAPNSEGEVPETPPDGWEAETGMEGGWRLRRPDRARRIMAMILWSLAVALITCTVLVAHRLDQAPITASLVTPLALVALFTLMATSAAVWVTWAREEWLIRPGRIEYRLTFGGRSRVDAFVTPTIAIERTVDSDGDILLALVVRAGATRRRMESSMNDVRPTLPLGRWVAARAEATLELPPELRNDEAA